MVVINGPSLKPTEIMLTFKKFYGDFVLTENPKEDGSYYQSILRMNYDIFHKVAYE